MSEYLDLNSATVRWKDYGGSGPVVILVHGLGGSVANWDVVAPRLSRLGRVIGFDLPGFGLSPPAADWELETQRDVIIEFGTRFAPRFTLIGNSLGALLIEMVASHRPDLVGNLVLVSPATPPVLPDPRIHWPTARRLFLNSTPGIGPAISRRMITTMTPRELIYEALARISHKPGRVPLPVVEELITIAETRRHYPWAPEAIPRTGAAIRRFFLRRSRFVEMIREIRAPTLVVQGIADPIVSPTSVEWVCRLRPDWALVQMEDTGHTPQLDAPVRFLGVIEPWLETRLKQEMAV